MRRVVTISLVLFFILLSQGCNKSAHTSIPVFYGQYCNAQRTSYRDVEGLKASPNKVAWQYTLTDADEIFFITMDAPTVEENKVFMVSGSIMSCVELDTGKEIWRRSYPEPFPAGSEFDYSPVVYKDKLIVVEGFPNAQYLAAFNKDTGDLLWKSELIGNMEVNDTSSHPLIINGKVYLAASSAEGYEKNKDAQAGIWVWDVETGKVLDKIFIEPVAEPIAGKHRSMFPVSVALAADGSNIYGVTGLTNDSTYRTYIFCYDTLRKKFTWFEPVGEEGFRSPGYRAEIAVDNNFVAMCMVGDQWGEPEPQFFIKVFDKTSHKPLWQNISETNRELNPVFTISYLAIHNGKLYAMLMDKRLACFNIETGEIIWSFEDKDWQSNWWNTWNKDENRFREHDIVVSKDVVYFNVDKAIYAFDTETGKLLWRKVVTKGHSFINIMPVDNGLIVRYQDNRAGYDMPQEPSIAELWK